MSVDRWDESPVLRAYERLEKRVAALERRIPDPREEALRVLEHDVRDILNEESKRILRRGIEA